MKLIVTVQLLVHKVFKQVKTFIVPALTTDLRDLSYQTTSTPSWIHLIIGEAN
jgi:hypothetical protein